MREVKKLLLLLFLLPLFLTARAHKGDGSEPALQGIVSDAYTKKPVKGVTISIQSPTIGEKEFFTDAEGNFKIPQLPPGAVTIIIEKKGYKTYRREGVIVKEGSSINLKFNIIVEEEADDNDIFNPLLRMIEAK